MATADGGGSREEVVSGWRFWGGGFGEEGGRDDLANKCGLAPLSHDCLHRYPLRRTGLAPFGPLHPLPPRHISRTPHAHARGLARRPSDPLLPAHAQLELGGIQDLPEDLGAAKVCCRLVTKNGQSQLGAQSDLMLGCADFGGAALDQVGGGRAACAAVAKYSILSLVFESGCMPHPPPPPLARRSKWPTRQTDSRLR